jgi:hypothetical protein
MPSERSFAAASQVGPHTWAEFLALDEEHARFVAGPAIAQLYELLHALLPLQ